MIIEAGQVAVVTGAARGMGRALAGQLAGRGVSVVLADTRAELLSEATEALGAQTLAVVTDVSDSDAVKALAARTLERFGRIDLVVNNAGIGSKIAPLWEADLQDWNRVVNINLLGVVHGIRWLVPHLVEAGRGHVVNMSSLAGLMSAPYSGAYAATKHAVVSISETLRDELVVQGLDIGVTVACPGFVRTPLVMEPLEVLRNNPDSVDAPTFPGMSKEQLIGNFERAVEQGIDAETAAERILAAVEADTFYALPNGDVADRAKARVDGVLAGLN